MDQDSIYLDRRMSTIVIPRHMLLHGKEKGLRWVNNHHLECSMIFGQLPDWKIPRSCGKVSENDVFARSLPACFREPSLRTL